MRAQRSDGCVETKPGTFFKKSTPELSQELWLRPWCCGGHCGLDYGDPGGKLLSGFSRGNLKLWRVQGRGSGRQDSENFDESFWDGQGVDTEARPLLT